MKKQVVNVNTGQLLGKVSDAQIDENGKIISLTVKTSGSFFGMFAVESSVMWDDIVNFRDDVILVRADLAVYSQKRQKLPANLPLYASAVLLILSLIVLFKSCTG